MQIPQSPTMEGGGSYYSWVGVTNTSTKLGATGLLLYIGGGYQHVIIHRWELLSIGGGLQLQVGVT